MVNVHNVQELMLSHANLLEVHLLVYQDLILLMEYVYLVLIQKIHVQLHAYNLDFSQVNHHVLLVL